MGTRSTIALEFADGTVKQVYCHWSGYLSHNGRILLEHYMDPFKVKTLVEMGYLSSLGAEIGEKVDFDAPTSDIQCKFYARDRDEDMVVDQYDSMDEYFEEGRQEEFDYIMRNIDGKATWLVRSDQTYQTWIRLEIAMLAKLFEVEPA